MLVDGFRADVHMCSQFSSRTSALSFVIQLGNVIPKEAEFSTYRDVCSLQARFVWYVLACGRTHEKKQNITYDTLGR